MALAAVSFNACTNSDKQAKIKAHIDSLSRLNPDLGRYSVEIEKSPNNADLYLSRGTIFYQMDLLDDAAKDLYKAIQLDSTNISYYLTFADINVKARYLKVAVTYLKKAEKMDPQNKEIAIKLAKVNLYLKEYTAVMEETNRVIGLDKTDERSYLLQGIVYKEKGDTTQAIRTFQIAVDNNPESYDAYMQLGLLCAAKHDAKAEKYLINAIRIDSLRYEGVYALAMYYQEHKQIRKAIDVYRNLIVRNPQEPQPIYNLGYIYYQLDSIKMAYNHFTLVIQTSPLNADAYYMRGLCNVKRKIRNEAISDFTQALRIREDFPEARKELDQLQGNK